MQRIRLTNERIKAFGCPEGKKQVFLWDSESPHLGVRATKGAKSYIFQGWLNGGALRITLGDVRDWPLESKDPDNPGAREEARRLQTLIDQKIDPREQKREQEAARAAKRAADAEARREAESRAKYTLKALCEAYADLLAARSKEAASDARSAFKCHLLSDEELANKPAREVTPLDLASAIRRVNEKGKARTAGKLRSYVHAAYETAIRAPLDSSVPADFIPFRIETNPAHPIPTVPAKSGKRTLSMDELKAYIEALKDDAIDSALKIALYAGGQRMQQLLRAGPNDWDGENLRLFDRKGRRREPREHLLPLGPVAAGIVDGLAEQAKARKSQHLFSSFGRVALVKHTISTRVSEISAGIDGEPFDLKDIRRTVETMLAGMKVSKDIRAQLLSHGISGVQSVHYDKHDYLEQKADTLLKWEQRLNEIVNGKRPAKVVKLKSQSRG